MITIQAFAKHHNLRLVSRRLTDDEVRDCRLKSYGIGATHWLCYIVAGRGKWRRRLRLTYSMGSAYRGRPRLADVLSCIKCDALSYVNAEDAISYAREYGCNTLIYYSCKRTYDSLSRLLDGDYIRDYLLYEIESL